MLLHINKDGSDGNTLKFFNLENTLANQNQQTLLNFQPGMMAALASEEESARSRLHSLKFDDEEENNENENYQSSPSEREQKTTLNLNINLEKQSSKGLQGTLPSLFSNSSNNINANMSSQNSNQNNYNNNVNNNSNFNGNKNTNEQSTHMEQNGFSKETFQDFFNKIKNIKEAPEKKSANPFTATTNNNFRDIFQANQTNNQQNQFNQQNPNNSDYSNFFKNQNMQNERIDKFDRFDRFDRFELEKESSSLSDKYEKLETGMRSINQDKFFQEKFSNPDFGHQNIQNAPNNQNRINQQVPMHNRIPENNFPINNINNPNNFNKFNKFNEQINHKFNENEDQYENIDNSIQIIANNLHTKGWLVTENEKVVDFFNSTDLFGFLNYELKNNMNINIY